MGSMITKRSENTNYKNISEDKNQKELSLETKNTQNHENRRLGLIESLHMQSQLCLRGYLWGGWGWGKTQFLN